MRIFPACQAGLWCAAAVISGCLFITPVADAATVFSNYNAINCTCGQNGPSVLAEGFTPSGSYDFTGAAAFVQNMNGGGEDQSISLALYSSSAGGPDASLWSSGALSVPGPYLTATLVTASYSGAPLVLKSGIAYFLAVSLSSNVGWLGAGNPPPAPFFAFNGSSWVDHGAQGLQFEVSGTAVPTVPEASTWAMLLIGFAGLGYAGYRRKDRAATA